MKFKLLVFFLVLLNQPLVAQMDTLNNYNSSGQKSGWWITYLDKDLAITKDSSLAKYYRYSYFKGKFDYYNMGRIGTKKSPVITSSSSQELGTPLEGYYKSKYRSGKVKYELYAKNGKLLEYKEYYKRGTLKTYFDYQKSCGVSPLNYCIYQYRKDGSLKYEGSFKVPK